MTKINSVLKMKMNQFRCFSRDQRGLAAVEFAFIAPVLILLFLGTLEISLAVAVDRKVSRVSSSVADLITQFDEDISSSEIDAIMDISERIMYPYNDPLGIVVSSVAINGGNAKVQWSKASGAANKLPTNSVVSVPQSIKTDNTTLLVATVTTSHAPAFKFVNYANGKLTFDGQPIDISETMYLRWRSGTPQTCSNC